MCIQQSKLFKFRLMAILLGTLIAFSFLYLNFHGTKSNFEDAATFGLETTSVYASINGYQINCIDNRDISKCIEGAKERHAEKSVLWLGNSQLHAINQWHKGETSATPILFNHLKLAGFDLVVFSEPNANLQEHWVLFEYLLHKLPLKKLILPVVFDDTREEGLRLEVAQLLEDQVTRDAISKNNLGQKLIKAKEAAAIGSEGNKDTVGIAHTLQEKIEYFFNNWLDEHWELWKERPEARGQFMMNYLYVWRNTLFGITPSTKRKVIRGRYQDNISALSAILDEASQHNISIYVYIAPIRNDSQIPYDENEYKSFKLEVMSLTDRYGAKFVNLENLVPANLWGSKDPTAVGKGAELDFMHFQAGGHKLLADELSNFVLDGQIKNRDRK